MANDGHSGEAHVHDPVQNGRGDPVQNGRTSTAAEPRQSAVEKRAGPIRPGLAAGALVLLAACVSGDGVPDASPRITTAVLATTTTSTTSARISTEVTVRGVVAGVSASARVVQLSPAVNGVANVTLSADTTLVRANGAPASLTDIKTGSTIEAVGRPGGTGTVVARKITLL